MISAILKLFPIFIGSNSSIYESEVLGGSSGSFRFELPYAISIVTHYPTDMLLGMGTFFNSKHVITTIEISEDVEKYKRHYFVRLPTMYNCKEYGIDMVLTNTKTKVVSTNYGVLKVSYKIETNRISLHEMYFLEKTSA